MTFETQVEDTDGDGRIDLIATDADGDGEVDAVVDLHSGAVDYDGDGVADDYIDVSGFDYSTRMATSSTDLV